MIANKICSQSKKKVQKERKMFTMKIAPNSNLARPPASYCGFDLVLSFMVLNDIVWYFYGIVNCETIWHFYDLIWQNIDLIGFESSFLAVIDPNSFGLFLIVFESLVFVLQCFSACKSC